MKEDREKLRGVLQKHLISIGLDSLHSIMKASTETSSTNLDSTPPHPYYHFFHVDEEKRPQFKILYEKVKQIYSEIASMDLSHCDESDKRVSLKKLFNYQQMLRKVFKVLDKRERFLMDGEKRRERRKQIVGNKKSQTPYVSLKHWLEKQTELVLDETNRMKEEFGKKNVAFQGIKNDTRGENGDNSDDDNDSDDCDAIFDKEKYELKLKVFEMVQQLELTEILPRIQMWNRLYSSKSKSQKAVITRDQGDKLGDEDLNETNNEEKNIGNAENEQVNEAKHDGEDDEAKQTLDTLSLHYFPGSNTIKTDHSGKYVNFDKMSCISREIYLLDHSLSNDLMMYSESIKNHLHVPSLYLHYIRHPHMQIEKHVERIQFKTHRQRQREKKMKSVM